MLNCAKKSNYISNHHLKKRQLGLALTYLEALQSHCTSTKFKIVLDFFNFRE